MWKCRGYHSHAMILGSCRLVHVIKALKGNLTYSEMHQADGTEDSRPTPNTLTNTPKIGIYRTVEL